MCNSKQKGLTEPSESHFERMFEISCEGSCEKMIVFESHAESLFETPCLKSLSKSFEYLNDMWQHEKEKEDGLLIQIQALGNDLINNLDIPIDPNPLLPNQSKFFKTVYQNPSRNSNQQFIDIE